MPTQSATDRLVRWSAIWMILVMVLLVVVPWDQVQFTNSAIKEQARQQEQAARDHNEFWTTIGGNYQRSWMDARPWWHPQAVELVRALNDGSDYRERLTKELRAHQGSECAQLAIVARVKEAMRFGMEPFHIDQSYESLAWVYAPPRYQGWSQPPLTDVFWNDLRQLLTEGVVTSFPIPLAKDARLVSQPDAQYFLFCQFWPPAQLSWQRLLMLWCVVGWCVMIITNKFMLSWSRPDDEIPDLKLLPKGAVSTVAYLFANPVQLLLVWLYNIL